MTDSYYHAASACPEVEALVLLDVAKRYPGQRKGLMAASALGVFGRDLGQERLMLTYIDSLVATKLLYRHNFGYHLTPSGIEHLEQLKSNLRGPLMRALS
jgi:hypothetical protein